MYASHPPESDTTVEIGYPSGTVPVKKHLIFAEKQPAYHPSNRPHEELRDIEEPITSASPEVRAIIERVLQAEKDKLYMKMPRNINDDILKIVKEEIQ
ncbi:hypothetical protein [Oscillatoria acuminata]|uniref:Uncharacterized protein n=1 Tax=Oscillatoria acuminata PCC 6304 TaxID=56110 RepID=K9TRP1_9CYAN|nr:hypothetical protein [Oscillatoria acuminata]AFY84801.1 hypothetical protein Oscil6304_5312 [Oscillatoria acuminata PCC 6304]